MTMKRFTKFFSLVCIAALAVSCYDDTKVWEKLNSLEKQLTELTSQVSAISTIVDAVEAGDYIKSVKPLADGGYEIDFAKADNLVIRDGKDGADAEAPVIGAVKDVDGIYYWTLDEEWLVDSEGNKVPAGVNQPKLKADGGQWYISADGANWDLIGPNVPCTISEVIPAEDAVTFKLAGGQEFVIPVVKALDITFDVEDGAAINGNTVIGYQIVGGTENNRVAVISSSVDAVVTPVDAKSGSIALTADELGNCEIVVFVTDGVSSTIFKTLKFEVGVLKVEDNVIELGCDAATFEIPVVTSLDYNVTVDADWVSESAATKSIEIREEVITLEVAANPGMNSRTATVTLAPKDEAYADWAISVAVVQEGHAVLSWTKIPTLDYADFTAGPVRLAKYGEYLLVSNTNKIFAVNPADGSLLNTFTLPEGFVCHSLCVDEGGHIIVANEGVFNWDYVNHTMLYVYSLDSIEAEPELLIQYSPGNAWGSTTGNVRVAGNIAEKALLTIAAAGSSYWFTFSAENGAVAVDENGWSKFTANTTPYSFNAANYGCVAPAGSELSDGLWFAAYGDDHSLRFCADPSVNEWVSVGAKAYGALELNPSSISLADFGGRSYAAVMAGAFFNYHDPWVVLYDVTDKAAAQNIYNFDLGTIAQRNPDWSLINWTGVGAYSDVLSVASDTHADVYFVDTNFNMIGCITIK